MVYIPICIGLNMFCDHKKHFELQIELNRNLCYKNTPTLKLMHTQFEEKKRNDPKYTY